MQSLIRISNFIILNASMVQIHPASIYTGHMFYLFACRSPLLTARLWSTETNGCLSLLPYFISSLQWRFLSMMTTIIKGLMLDYHLFHHLGFVSYCIPSQRHNIYYEFKYKVNVRVAHLNAKLSGEFHKIPECAKLSLWLKWRNTE